MIVNRLTVKNLIDFSRFSEYRQSNFANRLLIPKIKTSKMKGVVIIGLEAKVA